jgi:hypothetical protein
MSADVISLVEERQRKRAMKRLTRQVEKDLARVLSLLNRPAGQVPKQSRLTQTATPD